MDRFTLFSGTANVNLATAIGRELRVGLGACTVNRFPDGEVSVDIRETVHGREVFIVQPTCPPVNDHLMELLAMADACRRQGQCLAMGMWFSEREKNLFAGHLRRDFLSSRA